MPIQRAKVNITNLSNTTLSGTTTITGTLKTPSVVTTESLYSFSGTAYFDTAVNNGYYQPAAYDCYIKRYADIGSAIFPPSSSSASSHGLNAASVNASTWCANRQLFDVIGGCQFWRVPVTGTYTLTAKGAGRRANYDGYGRSVTCDFLLRAGEWLRIICGAQGESNGSNFSGGHGASCISVFRQGKHIPILIGAGGAGLSGNSAQSNQAAKRDAKPPQSSYGQGATQGHASGHFSGREGMGGHGSFYQQGYDSYIEHWGGGGGGGWGSPGNGGNIGKNLHESQAAGRALSEHCPHGGYYESGDCHHGGFGGGGATGQSSGAAGGGGGYIGGNAAYTISSSPSDDTNIMGGISYCAATSFTDNGTHSTYGQVQVSL